MRHPEQRAADLLDSLPLPDAVRVRPWDESDFPEVRRLSGLEGWPTPNERPEEALEAWRESWPALVATAGDRLIGFVRALSDSEVTIYVAEVLVESEWRGQGIGKALLEACHLLQPHARLDLLSTEQSHDFYAALGFREYRGFRRNYER